MNPFRVAIKLFSMTFLLAKLALAQSAWQLTSRLQTGVEYDSNIYESTARQVSTSVGRFLMQNRALLTAQHWRISLDYAGALLVYQNHRDENKLLQDANGSITWLAKNGFRLYLRGQGNLKLYLQSPTDYGTTSGTLGVIFPLTKKIFMEAGAETGQLDYARGNNFDFTFTGASLALRRQLGAKAMGEAAVVYRKLEYARASFVNAPANLDPETQQDDFTALRLSANYSKHLLLQGRLELQRNRSNRGVFGYNRAQLHVLVGYPPLPHWLVRVSFLLQRKRYLDAAPPISLPELDPEREQSNHLVLDISRDLSQTLALLLRLSHHNNESPVRSFFYRKTLLFAGLEMRF